MMRMLSSRAFTIKELAQEFSVTSRQVRRDLAEVEAGGHPLTSSGGPGEKTWQLPLGYKGLPPVALNRYELMSLQLARASLSHLKGTPFLDDLDEVIVPLTISWTRLLPYSTRLPDRIDRRSALLGQVCASGLGDHPVILQLV
jgi:hypothetical protein